MKTKKKIWNIDTKRWNLYDPTDSKWLIEKMKLKGGSFI